MPKRGKGGASKTSFCLLRWIEDETVSVLPVTAAKSGQKVYPGIYGEFKWLRQLYEAEVLKVSGKKGMVYNHSGKNTFTSIYFQITDRCY